MADKKYFKLNQEKKTITVDTTVNPAKGDKEAVALYVEMGYSMVIKSQARAKQMSEKADKTATDYNVWQQTFTLPYTISQSVPVHMASGGGFAAKLIRK